MNQIFGHQDNLNTYKSECTYLQKKFLSKIDRSKVKTIFELGSLHALDAILLERYYQCPVYSFECNPKNILRAKNNIKKYHSSVILVEKAVAEETGEISFFPCTTHPSTSSIYPFDYQAMENNKQGSFESLQKTWAQEKIMVDSIRLDDFMRDHHIPSVDLLCIDIQGATLPALKSLGDYLNQVKYVICEVEYAPVYSGESVFAEIKSFMQSHGFTCYFQESNILWNDVLFVREK